MYVVIGQFGAKPAFYGNYTEVHLWAEVEAGRMDPTKDRGIPWDYWRKMAAIGINATYNEPFSGLGFNDDSPNGVYLRKRWGE